MSFTGSSISQLKYSLVESEDGEEIDNFVNSKEKLARVPPECRSDDPTRPLLYTDADGNEFKYALNPMTYCVMFILIVELLERFSYYGISNSEQQYLTGGYDEDWNAGFKAVDASSFVSTSTALAYISPFIGGILADGLLGDYWNIIVGVALFYIPGLLIIALCSYPELLGEEFNIGALYVGMLILWPFGTGLIKSVVNVFGAKQFHPWFQGDMIESYYISFYGVINIGALSGGIIIPLVAQSNISIAYTIPAVALVLGLIVFLLGTTRYVKRAPEKKALFTSLKVLTAPVTCQSMDSKKESRGGTVEDRFVDGTKMLLYVFPVTCLILPMCIAYNQMATVFVVQGGAMKTVGFIDASMMTNFDSLSVLLNSALYQMFMVPALESNGINAKTSHKFAVGTGFGALAIMSAIIIDYQIHKGLEKGEQVSILWQVFAYFFVGAGEILTMALSYDVAFKVAPKEQKGLASGINLFVIGCVSNLICIALQQGCGKFFPIDSSDLEDYASSQLYVYLWVLFGICVAGIGFNLLPPVTNWLENLTDRSMEMNASVAKKKGEEHLPALAEGYLE